MWPRNRNSAVSESRFQMMMSVSLLPLASLEPSRSNWRCVTALRWPLKLTTIWPDSESHIRIAPSVYPTANKSGWMSHCDIHVTSLLLSLSCHRDSSSPFFTSQQRTSSFAPTKALPFPALRLEPSDVQMEFEAAVQTVQRLVRTRTSCNC